MQVMKGHCDHFVPLAKLRRVSRDALVYEWSNLRYGDGVINQRKGDSDVLDPFEVRDDWFKVLLPSLQLVLTDAVPSELRLKAEFTLQRLGLRDDEVVVRYRRQWYRLYLGGDLSLEGLRRVAPLVARAVEHERTES